MSRILARADAPRAEVEGRKMGTLLRAEEILADKLLPDCDAFRLFALLPAEIQDEIWTQALPCRILRFSVREIESTKNCRFLSPPSVAHVCQRARRVALRTGSWQRIPSLKASTSSLVRQVLNVETEDRRRQAVQEQCAYTWFDRSRDALFLDKHNILAQPKELKKLAETVVYAGFRCDEMSIFHMDTFINSDQWPRLNTVEVILNAVPDATSSPEQGPIYLVRPDDVPALLQSMSLLPYWGTYFKMFEDEVLLQCFLGYTQSSFTQHLSSEIPTSAFKELHYSADGVVCKCRMRSWKKYKSDVRCMWFWYRDYSRIKNQVDQGEDIMTAPLSGMRNLGWSEKFNHEHPWVETQLKEMHGSKPQLRPILRWAARE